MRSPSFKPCPRRHPGAVFKMPVAQYPPNLCSSRPFVYALRFGHARAPCEPVLFFFICTIQPIAIEGDDCGLCRGSPQSTSAASAREPGRVTHHYRHQLFKHAPCASAMRRYGRAWLLCSGHRVCCAVLGWQRCSWKETPFNVSVYLSIYLI